MRAIENYIGGELIKPVSDKYLDNFNPATGEVYSLIPDSDERDVEKAVEAAKNAFPVWSKMSAEQRHDILMKIVALIERDLDALATAESVDNGKPKTLAKQVDIPRAVSNF
nr:aldehyde dehydrogenase family protein [Acidobacteriota bacterium]